MTGDPASEKTAWHLFVCQLQEVVHQPGELAKWANSALPEFHQQLHTDPKYQYKVAQATSKQLQRYNDSELLFKNPNVKASLVAIDKGRPLPLHDHPGTAGLMFVIEGSVNVQHCDAEPHHPMQPLSLNVIQANTLNKGEVSWFTEDERNIHSVEAVSRRAVLLTMHARVSSPQQQSYYFPLSGGLHAGSRIQVQRVNTAVFGRHLKESALSENMKDNHPL